ncbi:MAG: MBL fold hydrolase [Ignavibacteria bacterium GWA2_35_9]|nr:MAG: MBL fold hydrolase [Ignavibacteria bacterium GWA2_35_9]OGU52929.1 MAG: MBL fold hydrolase [Ignavibacteria bacterium GWC2_36_12]OGU99439.1 MAG: MBL fold hydrolase [Ignavibacteria bacterium RIFOXYB2_FULL_36_7]
MINIKKFTFNSFAENTYVLWDEETKEALIVDPGCSDTYEEKELEDFISSNKLNVKYLVNTHCHIDHIFGCGFVKEKFKVPYYAPEKDVPLIEHFDKQVESVGMEVSIKPPLPDHFITEDLIISLGKSKPVFLYTPGHTPGEYCIYFPQDNFCITGDVLFQNSIGRTDFWGGDYNILLESIINKLLVLPDETIIYPGHSDKSTIGEEKRYNPFLIELINKN